MRRIAILSLAALMLASGSAAAQFEVPSGIWSRDDGNARVRIHPCGEAICATNVWIGDTSKGEAVGDRLIMTLKPKAANVLSGKAYDPKRGLTFSMTMTVGDKAMSTRGCIVGGMLCKNVNWKPAR